MYVEYRTITLIERAAAKSNLTTMSMYHLGNLIIDIYVHTYITCGETIDTYVHRCKQKFSTIHQLTGKGNPKILYCTDVRNIPTKQM